MDGLNLSGVLVSSDLQAIAFLRDDKRPLKLHEEI